MNAGEKYVLLGSLWFTQMVPMGFLLTGVPTILRQQGRSLEEIGLVGLVALPWALKFLWAPVVDIYGSRRFGHYRSWIVLLQSLLVLALCLTAQFELKTSYHTLLALFTLICLISATQDIATDALAVNLLAVEERGWANGMQMAANFLGSIVGGGLMLVLYSRWGWRWSLLLVALLVALPLLAVLRARDLRRRIAGGIRSGRRCGWLSFANPRAAVWRGLQQISGRVVLRVFHPESLCFRDGQLRPVDARLLRQRASVFQRRSRRIFHLENGCAHGTSRAGATRVFSCAHSDISIPPTSTCWKA